MSPYQILIYQESPVCLFAGALVEEHMERVLIAAIDCEQDATVTALLASTITSVVLAGGLTDPGTWIHSFGALLQGSVDWRKDWRSSPASALRGGVSRTASGITASGMRAGTGRSVAGRCFRFG